MELPFNRAREASVRKRFVRKDQEFCLEYAEFEKFTSSLSRPV
jgi:hypothetical protein